MSWLGIDIGGANLKLADGRGYAASREFALWKHPEQLPAALAELLAAAPPAERLAVTMTGELCDCYVTKREGVRDILRAVGEVAGGRTISVYHCDSRFVSLEETRESPLPAAASNWHALARFAGRFAPDGAGLLIDVGSTTTDLIPLADGVPCGRGIDDTSRLIHGELVYTGVERSPLCAIAASVPYRGHDCPLSQEFFATSLDVYLTLGLIAEEAGSCRTADGRPATKQAARDRLAHQICADRETFNEEDAREMAEGLMAAQLDRITAAAPRAPRTIILSGSGEFLAAEAARRIAPAAQTVALSDRLGPRLSRAAAAHAVAVLARELLP